MKLESRIKEILENDSAESYAIELENNDIIEVQTIDELKEKFENLKDLQEDISLEIIVLTSDSSSEKFVFPLSYLKSILEEINNDNNRS
jgi:hypothetical protein